MYALCSDNCDITLFRFPVGLPRILERNNAQ